MPEFESYVDVDVDEFLSACSPREIEKLIEYLIEDGHLDSKGLPKKNEPKSLMEEEWDEITDNLREKRLNISNEDEETIRKISKKY